MRERKEKRRLNRNEGKQNRGCAQHRQKKSENVDWKGRREQHERRGNRQAEEQTERSRIHRDAERWRKRREDVGRNVRRQWEA